MIRRGFWLIVGAAGGIIGYRRVSSVGRQVAQTLGGAPKSPAARKRHWVRESIRFTRDVRAGMDLYFDRHRGAQDPTLDASTRDGRTTGNRTTGNRTTGNRTTGNQVTGKRVTGNRGMDNQATASRATASRTTANRVTANRVTGKRALSSPGHDKREDH